MSSSVEELELLNYTITYLDNIIRYFNEIYTCQCESCIQKSVYYEDLIPFYNFIFENRKFIKDNENYLKSITEVVKLSTEFHKYVGDENIIFHNKRIQVINCYLEEEFRPSKNYMFDIATYVHYHPEMAEHFSQL